MSSLDFLRITLRLKERLCMETDAQVAAVLGLKPTSFNERKKRNSFPELRLRATAQARPELELDVDYILTGEIQKAPATRAAPDQVAIHESVQKDVRESISWLGDVLRQIERGDRVDALDSLRIAERHVKRIARAITRSLRESRNEEAT